MYTREFDASIQVDDAINFCLDADSNILSELKLQFVGRNYKNTHIVDIKKIIERSQCIFNKTGLDAKSTINVRFEASVNILTIGDIIYPVEILLKDPMVIGRHKSNYEIAVSCINPAEFITVKLKQNVPIVVEQSLHEYKMKQVSCVGRILTHSNNNLPCFKIIDDSNEHSKVAMDLIDKIEFIKKEIKKLPEEIVEFFEKLYEPDNLITPDFDLIKLIREKKKIPTTGHLLCRNNVRRTGGGINLSVETSGDTKNVISEHLSRVILVFLHDILNYNRLIYDLTKSNSSKSTIRDNNNIWKIIKPKIQLIGGFEEIKTEISIIAGNEAVAENDSRFSAKVIEASNKYGSKFKWDLIRITKETPSVSLMPWHQKSHNKILHEIIGDRKLQTIIDLTAHVGIDSINLVHEFPDAKLIGIEIEPDICRIYKCNLALIPNKYEAICGNAIDIINTLEPHTDQNAKCLIYFDPPWGGSDYKLKDTVDLALTDIRGNTFNMHSIIRMIFNKQIGDIIILKTPVNYDDSKILQEPTWSCKKYEVKNETIPGTFGRTSYLLFSIEPKNFIPPSFKDGKQFQYIFQNDELRDRLDKLLGKFGIDLSVDIISQYKEDIASITDIEIYQKICKLKKEETKFGKSRGFKRFQDISKFTGTPATYMDIGAGDCEITAVISQELKLKKSETFGIDYIGKPSDKASKNVTFHLVKPGDKIPIPSGNIDLITAFQSLHHFQDIQYKLEEITRVANKNAIFIIREHDIDDMSIYRPLVDVEHLVYMICFEKMSWHTAIEEYYAHYRTKNEWTRMLSNLGWQLDKIIDSRDSPTNYYYGIYSKKWKV